MKARTARIKRKTTETNISVSLNLDGTGAYKVSTGLPFMDHMLELFSRHALINMTIAAKGDLEVDYHHLVEDLGIVLGQALDRALGDRKGIQRYGSAFVPMDEALSRVVVDLGGRPYLCRHMKCRKRKILEFDLSLFDEFFRSLVVHARMNLHIDQIRGEEAHHAYESVFKGLARALRMACAIDSRDVGVPSSKGSL